MANEHLAPNYHKHGVWSQIKHNPRLICNSILLALCFFTFGYDGSVVSGLLEMRPFNHEFSRTGGVLSSTEVSLIAAVPITGVFFGLPLAAGLGDYTGRRNTLLIACIISAVASAIQTAASNLATLVVGRVIAAAAIYMFIVLASTYMAELAPAEIRGILVGLTNVLIDAASILAAGLNWAFSKTMTNLAWRIPVGIQIIFPLIIAAGIFTLDAAPTEYLVKSQDEAALRSLRRIRKGYNDVEIDAEFDSLRAQSSLRSEETAAPILDMFKGTNLRRSFLACSIGVFQQLSGITFATTYATVFLSQASAGINPYLLTLGLSILATGGAIVGLFLVDSVGRRTLALSVFCVIFVIDLVIGVLGFFNDSPASAKAIAAFSLMFAFFFAAGFGPLTYVAASELPTARLKNRTSAFAFGCIAIMNVVVTFVIPYISQPDGANLGAKTYLIFAGWMLGCIVITFLWFPETKGRSSAELDEMFEARVPARKFKSYVCSVATENFEMSAKGIVDTRVEVYKPLP